MMMKSTPRVTLELDHDGIVTINRSSSSTADVLEMLVKALQDAAVKTFLIGEMSGDDIVELLDDADLKPVRDLSGLLRHKTPQQFDPDEPKIILQLQGESTYTNLDGIDGPQAFNMMATALVGLVEQLRDQADPLTLHHAISALFEELVRVASDHSTTYTKEAVEK